MTTEVAAVFKELRRHGVAAYRLDAEHIRLIPKAAVTPELLALIRQAKPALLPVLPPAPPFDHRDSCDGTCDESGEGRIACQAPPGKSASADGTVDAFLAECLDPGARAALGWWYDQGHPEILDDELRVLHRLENVGPVPDVRAELLRLVERVRALRAAYWRTRTREGGAT
jgi:hypothetical protein